MTPSKAILYDFIKYPREPEGRSCRVPSILSICRNRGLAIFESSQPAGLGCSTCFNVLVPHPGSETAFYGHEEQGDSQPQDDGTAIHPDLPRKHPLSRTCRKTLSPPMLFFVPPLPGPPCARHNAGNISFLDVGCWQCQNHTGGVL